MSIRSSYELTRLFLALSDVTRQQLLNQLSEPTSVIDICATFNVLVHEALRHLRRLEDVALIHQLSNGEYVISHYGQTIVPLIEGMSNVHDLLEYWEGHTATELPVHLSCLPAQLDGMFLGGTTLFEATQEALDESSEFLWALNYPVDRLRGHVSELKILARDGVRTQSNARVIQDVYSSLIVNECRAFIFFPGVKSNGEVYNDLANGFMIREANPTYRLVVEFFTFLWDKWAHSQLSGHIKYHGDKEG